MGFGALTSSLQWRPRLGKADEEGTRGWERMLATQLVRRKQAPLEEKRWQSSENLEHCCSRGFRQPSNAVAFDEHANPTGVRWASATADRLRSPPSFRHQRV